VHHRQIVFLELDVSKNGCPIFIVFSRSSCKGMQLSKSETLNCLSMLVLGGRSTQKVFGLAIVAIVKSKTVHCLAAATTLKGLSNVTLNLTSTSTHFAHNSTKNCKLRQILTFNTQKMSRKKISSATVRCRMVFSSNLLHAVFNLFCDF
jgi:hypothetical protein